MLSHPKFAKPQELGLGMPCLHPTWLLFRETLTFTVRNLTIPRAPDGTFEVPVVLSIWPGSSAHLHKEQNTSPRQKQQAGARMLSRTIFLLEAHECR